MTVPATLENENTLFDGLVDSVTCRYFRRNRFSAARALRECVARQASRSKSMTTNDNVRKQCATARKIDKRDMNPQDCMLQNVTVTRFPTARTFCGAEVEESAGKLGDKGHNPVGNAQVGSSLPTAIQDGNLMPSERGFGDAGTKRPVS